ncbi:MAG: hypothetical protein WDN23_03565 [Edaphobacter sp.]
MDRLQLLRDLAQLIAQETPEFFEVKGPGKGDHASIQFMKELREIAHLRFGTDLSEKKCITSAKMAFDFYLEAEASAVEIALSLEKPISEYERDIFKCLLAKDEGLPIKCLVFIAKPGALKKLNAPAPRAIAEYVRREHKIEIVIWELERCGPAVEAKL